MGEMKMPTKLWWEFLKEGGHSEKIGVDGKNICMYIREIGRIVVDWKRPV
jgi:hypothetical protein